MVLTRATDNRLKAFFTGGEIRYGRDAVSGQRLSIARPGSDLRGGDPAAPRRVRIAAPDGRWTGDVVGPVIRDLGVALAMRPEPATVRMVLNAQMGKAGAPLDGKDLHIGDFEWGILPPAAPLTTAALTMAGMAMAFSREGSGRVALSFIGEGGSSLGEWHEAINLCAARRLPAVFCIENNQTALSTPRRRADRRPRVRRQGDRLRHSGHHDRRHRSRCDCRGIRLGGRAGARRAGSDADRDRVDAHVRPRPPRRHAVSRPRSAAVVGLPAARRARLRGPRAVRILGRPRSAVAPMPRGWSAPGSSRPGISSGSSGTPRRSWSAKLARWWRRPGPIRRWPASRRVRE